MRELLAVAPVSGRGGTIIPTSQIYLIVLSMPRNLFKKGNIPWNKGKKGIYSEEHRRKMSESMKGMFSGKKNFWYGKHHSEEHKKKMSIWTSKYGHRNGMLGKKHSEETKKKISKKILGRKKVNPITPLNTALRVSLQYKLWRKFIYKRDRYTCQNCFIYGVDVEVHHIKSFALIIHENNIKTFDEAIGCEELWDTNNGQVLCSDCHKKTNNFAFRVWQQKVPVEN